MREASNNVSVRARRLRHSWVLSLGPRAIVARSPARSPARLATSASSRTQHCKAKPAQKMLTPTSYAASADPRLIVNVRVAERHTPGIGHLPVGPRVQPARQNWLSPLIRPSAALTLCHLFHSLEANFRYIILYFLQFTVNKFVFVVYIWM